MKLPPSARAVASMLALTLAVVGCAGGPPPQRLYRLDSAAPAAAGARQAAAEPAVAVPAAAGIWLLSPRVALPEYLERDAIVVADGSRLDPLDGVRWAEPLRDAVPRLLRADLEALRGAGRVWSGPLPPGLTAQRALRVEIVELHGDAVRREVRLVARWVLEDPAGREPPRAGRAELAEPLSATSADALVDAHRRALWELARRMTAAR